MLTGLWPHTSGCTNHNIHLSTTALTLPELLADSEYRTAYMGKWHLGDEIFPQRGFQEWVSMEDGYYRLYGPERDPEARSDYHHYLRRFGYQPDDQEGNRFSRAFAARLPREHCKAAFLGREVSRFVLENRSRPWMLYANFVEPHMPFFGPLGDLHSNSEAPVPNNYPGVPVEKEPENFRRMREILLESGFEGHDLKTAAGWQRLNRNCAGLCSQVDQAIGRILWALEVSGQADNTIVVFTTDHGEMMGSHSLIGKQVLYEESVWLPLLLRVPFRHHGSIHVGRPVSHIDLVPTLLGLLGQSVPENLPGHDLLPLLEGEEPVQDHVFIEWNAPTIAALVGSPTWVQSNARAVISPEGWKLCLYDCDHSLLFQRDRDPLEMDNLYYRESLRPIIRQLHRKIEDWQRSVGDTLELH